MDYKLPTYEMRIDNPEEGVSFISVVEDPAIEINWFAFSKETSQFNFQFADEEKRMIAGPFMIPDLKIFRRDSEGNEFNVYFTKDTIEKIVKKFMREQRTLNVNEEHTNKIAPAFVMENWIIEDPENDKSKLYGFNLPKGTWFGIMHVEDEDYWKDYIKTGKVKGFSVEGLMSLSDKPKEETMKKSKTYSHFVKTSDGVTLVNGAGDEILNPGDEVFILEADGTTVPAPEGEHVLEDGAILTIVNGRAESITAPANMAEETQLAVTPEEQTAIISEVMQILDPQFVGMREEFLGIVTAMSQEFTELINSLNDRVVALEGSLTSANETMSSQAEVIEKQNEEIKKFASMIPGGKSQTIVKNIENIQTDNKFSKLRSTFEAIQSYKTNK